MFHFIITPIWKIILLTMYIDWHDSLNQCILLFPIGSFFGFARRWIFHKLSLGEIGEYVGQSTYIKYHGVRLSLGLRGQIG